MKVFHSKDFQFDVHSILEKAWKIALSLTMSELMQRDAQSTAKAKNN